MKSSFFRKPNRQKLPLFSFLCLTFLVYLLSCGGEQSHNPTTDKTPNMPGIGEARDISSFDLVAEMGVGWNLGNSFDVTSRDKTLWGNPIPSKPMIDAVKMMGFKTLRIPITWGLNQSENAPYNDRI